MASSVTIPRGMRSTPMTQDELQAYARTLRDKGVGKESVQGPAAQQEAMPEMTMEQAMLSPVAPERAFNHPMYSTMNAPTATTRNAPRPSTINSPRPSTLNAPRLPEPSMMEMDMPPPAMEMPLPAGALAPNGMEDWGSAVYAPGGGMRPIPELQALPRHVQAELARRDPLLSPYLGGQQALAPLISGGGLESATRSQPYVSPMPLDQMPTRNVGFGPGSGELLPPLGQMSYGQPGGNVGPSQFEEVGTIDMGDGPERWVGQPTPPETREDQIRRIETDIANATGALSTSGPAARAGYLEQITGGNAALDALRGSSADQVSATARYTQEQLNNRNRETLAARLKSYADSNAIKTAALKAAEARNAALGQGAAFRMQNDLANAYTKQAENALAAGDYAASEQYTIEASRALDRALDIASGGGAGQAPPPRGGGVNTSKPTGTRDTEVENDTGVPGATREMIKEITDFYGTEISDEFLIEELKRKVAELGGG